MRQLDAVSSRVRKTMSNTQLRQCGIQETRVSNTRGRARVRAHLLERGRGRQVACSYSSSVKTTARREKRGGGLFARGPADRKAAPESQAVGALVLAGAAPAARGAPRAPLAAAPRCRCAEGPNRLDAEK